MPERRTLKVGTRLLLPLLVVVALVMMLFAGWALRHRITNATANAQRETQAYAVALELALEAAFRDPDRRDVQQTIDRISTEPTIFGVLVYGEDGEVLYTSDAVRRIQPAGRAVVDSVLAGVDATLERELDDQPVYSVLRPIRGPGDRVVGAFEVAQPLRFLEAELERTRSRFLLNTLTLLAALTVVSLLLVRRLIAAPLARLLAGVQAIGRGELGYRMPAERGGAELAEVADEFNGMADRLEQARSELLREAAERLDLERRLRENEKMAVVGTLATGLAHEIGAPLHVIRGRAEMLQRGDPTPDERRRNLGIVVEQIDRIARIVRGLLDLSRRRQPRMENIDAAAVVRGVTDFLEPELAQNAIRLSWDGADSIPVRGDAQLLHQVFLNVMVNAVQAVRGRDGDRRITVRAGIEQSGDGARGVIEVVDTGGGIPEGAAARLFEPFFTTKEPGEGTGLGLAIARSIVDEHGGAMEAFTENGGARIRIALPLRRG